MDSTDWPNLCIYNFPTVNTTNRAGHTAILQIAGQSAPTLFPQMAYESVDLSSRGGGLGPKYTDL